MYINLLANSGLTAVPNYAKNSKEKFLSNVKFSQKLNYRTVFDMLDIEINDRCFKSFSEGINFLKEKNRKNENTIIGVTTYYLPYSKDFKNKRYISEYETRTIGITNHYILVIDINDEFLQVYDTTPIVCNETLSIDNLSKAWLGDSKIDEFSKIVGIDSLSPYTYLEIDIKKDIKEKRIMELSFQLLATIVFEYLDGKVLKDGETNYFYGITANVMVIEELRDISNRKVLSEKEVHQIEICLIEMQISRCFFRDFLKDISEINSVYIKIFNETNFLLEEMKKVISKIRLIFARKKYDVNRLNENFDILEKLFKKEKMIYEEIESKLTSKNKVNSGTLIFGDLFFERRE
ncbi:hypothetical protein BCR26_04245 [Enterococcus rivorum]|uniref:Butirosin biosynthesis protein H N-terminal domain-containing protein n=2 Tax=Enterococcus rivorum TaxID=762845 RepID=A0A1E5KUA2_9ENTE|nr:hypothetical protein BCR26_04245 [Enterococcus rivorum]